MLAVYIHNDNGLQVQRVLMFETVILNINLEDLKLNESYVVSIDEAVCMRLPKLAICFP